MQALSKKFYKTFVPTAIINRQFEETALRHTIPVHRRVTAKPIAQARNRELQYLEVGHENARWRRQMVTKIDEETGEKYALFCGAYYNTLVL